MDRDHLMPEDLQRSRDAFEREQETAEKNAEREIDEML